MSANTTAQARFKHVIEYAREEAVLRGDRRIGTDHLLLALLHDGDAPPARALRVSLADGRAALEELDRAAELTLTRRLARTCGGVSGMSSCTPIAASAARSSS
ncbi:Clp protease N-terminal domain-containing protein, partial [Actinacidiphila rubida]|uniref:Clp protease N-terminal domain-containing protein n=1 Tax=Actinacidiphila rubida TaxID=310780 RepID=UPI002AFDE203